MTPTSFPTPKPSVLHKKETRDVSTAQGELSRFTARTILGLILSIAFVIAVVAAFGYLSQKRDGQDGRVPVRRRSARRSRSRPSPASHTRRRRADPTHSSPDTTDSDEEPLPLYTVGSVSALESTRPPSYRENPPSLPPVPLPNVPPLAHIANESMVPETRRGNRHTRL